MNNKITLLGGLATLALVSSASAEVKLTDNLSVAGYAAGSYQYADNEGTSKDRLDIDAANVDFNFKKDQVSAKIGFYYVPVKSSDVVIASAPFTSTTIFPFPAPREEIALLDVNLTYDFGGGHSVTGGKYLSWLGYEAFHIPSRTFVTPNFTTQRIPGYRSGVKYTYASSDWNGGVGVSDSEFASLKGDGELRNNYASEAFISYTGVKDLTIFAGVGYEHGTMPLSGVVAKINTYIVNLWASYNLNANLSVASEYVYVDNKARNRESHSFMTEAKYKIDDKLAIAGRINYDHHSSAKIDGIGFSIAPTYKVTSNLEVRSEVGYQDFGSKNGGETINFGVQTVFTF